MVTKIARQSILMYVSFAFIVSLSSVVFAQQNEELTLTTYYPAPFGEYNTLQANSLSVGTGVDVPVTDGVIRFGSLAADPNLADSIEGDQYYNSVNHELRYFNGTSWVAVGATTGGDRLVSVNAVYQSFADVQVEFPKPVNVDYAIINMISVVQNWGSTVAEQEESEYMYIYLDFTAPGGAKATGTHALVAGANDPLVLNYTWQGQPFGSQVATESGDDEYGPTAFTGVITNPQFDIIEGGSKIRISNVSSGNALSHTYFVMFYKRGD